MTPEQQQRLVNALHDAAVVIEDCAKQFGDDRHDYKNRLYARAQLYRDLLKSVEAAPDGSDLTFGLS